MSIVNPCKIILVLCKSFCTFPKILSYSLTYYVRHEFVEFCLQELQKQRTFWSDGYFVCSIGETWPDTIRQYILKQASSFNIPQAEEPMGFALHYIQSELLERMKLKSSLAEILQD